MKAQDKKVSLKHKSEQARKGFRPTSESRNLLEFSGNYLGIIWELFGDVWLGGSDLGILW